MIPADFIPYELTPEQVTDGWETSCHDGSARLCYLHGVLLEDPAPGVPAQQGWHANGQEFFRMHYSQGLLSGPAPGVPAYQQWGENGRSVLREHSQRNVNTPADFHTWDAAAALACT